MSSSNNIAIRGVSPVILSVAKDLGKLGGFSLRSE